MSTGGTCIWTVRWLMPEPLRWWGPKFIAGGGKVVHVRGQSKSNNMKTLVCIQPGEFAYREADAPLARPGHSIIKIKRIGICGTDLHAFEGTQPFFAYPRILGHELAGDLVDLDRAPGFQPGEAVTIIPYYNDGTCIACRTGKPNCCTALRVAGFSALLSCSAKTRAAIRSPAPRSSACRRARRPSRPCGRPGALPAPRP